jgi:formamidopyrimidine-DNA glycosylase
MTGRLLVALPGERCESRHPAITFLLDHGGRLVYDDVRRFGSLDVLDRSRWRAWSQGLGPEPLSRSFTARSLRHDLGHSRTPIRSWLLDQKKIAGIGNIYANEALFLAKIHPYRPAGSLGDVETRALHRALRKILRSAVEARGTTLRDYRDPLGQQGSFGPQLAVYGREGGPCPRCGGVVMRTVFGNRSAFFCSRCQPEP